MTIEAHRDDWSAVTSAAATAPTSTVEADGKRARAILVARYSLVEERDSRLQQLRMMMRAKSETALARSVGRTRVDLGLHRISCAELPKKSKEGFAHCNARNNKERTMERGYREKERSGRDWENR